MHSTGQDQEASRDCMFRGGLLRNGNATRALPLPPTSSHPAGWPVVLFLGVSAALQVLVDAKIVQIMRHVTRGGRWAKCCLGESNE